MNQPDSAIEKSSWKTFNENVSQIRDKTINRLLGLCFFYIIVAVITTTIQIWVPVRFGTLGISKDTLTPLVAAIGLTFGYGFIKDRIAEAFDAGTGDIKDEVEKRLHEDNRKVLEKIDESTIKYNSDFKYLAYIKPIISFDELQSSEVSSKLTKERGDNVSAFEKKLDIKLEESKNIREVRYKIHSLTNEFLKKLAFFGIVKALGLEIEDADKKTKPGGKFRFLSLDVYAYLSAWLICSIDNDTDDVMPIAYIGMRHTNEDNVSNKETYKKVIQAIRNIIIDGSYTDIYCYRDTNDALSFAPLRKKVVDRLDELIDLIENHPV
jgi:hypothetical protein